MNKRIKKQRIIDKIELLYRNFGSKWTINEFFKDENDVEFRLRYLKFLSKKGIIILNEDKSFEIIDLPSNHIGLLDGDVSL